MMDTIIAILQDGGDSIELTIEESPKGGPAVYLEVHESDWKQRVIAAAGIHMTRADIHQLRTMLAQADEMLANMERGSAAS